MKKHPAGRLKLLVFGGKFKTLGGGRGNSPLKALKKSLDVKTLDPGELDSESKDEVLMATSIPLKEELLSSDLRQ